MEVGRYLPSAQFVLVVVSFALSAGLVYAAEAFTHRSAAHATVSVAQDTGTFDTNWEAALYAIDANNASSRVDTSSPEAVDKLIAAAQTSNITDSVGKALLLNLADAKSQGLGDDIPTQDQIVAAAQAQMQ